MVSIHQQTHAELLVDYIIFHILFVARLTAFLI
jgi:hypothetical protein